MLVQGSNGKASLAHELLEGEGLADLVIAALQLYLDPLTNLLAPDLEVRPPCMPLCQAAEHFTV